MARISSRGGKARGLGFFSMREIFIPRSDSCVAKAEATQSDQEMKIFSQGKERVERFSTDGRLVFSHADTFSVGLLNHDPNLAFWLLK